MISTPPCSMFQQHSTSSRSTIVGIRHMKVGDDAKLPLFHGNGTEDPEQYWFLCEYVWSVKQITDDEVKKG